MTRRRHQTLSLEFAKPDRKHDKPKLRGKAQLFPQRIPYHAVLSTNAMTPPSSRHQSGGEHFTVKCRRREGSHHSLTVPVVRGRKNLKIVFWRLR
jgi:hypothetical protein